ncbi:MAG TPA: methyltransferase domain-containing protein [Polyangia bacterium]|nr:methyltransferase domain-containing protein [Polyangia bacterium]
MAAGAPDVSPDATPRPGVAPACPLFGACGGCQYQHLAYEDQLALKTDRVRGLFAAMAADVAACVPCPAPYGYRSKLTPHFARPRPDREPAIGFLRGDRRVTLDVTACPIATPAVNARLATLRAEVRERWSEYRRGATLLVREATSGVTVDPRAVVTERVGDLELQFLAGDFFQNNPFLLPCLVEHVAREAAAGGARFLVDAYCGSGLLGLAAAPRFERVLGVEVSPSAVRWARDNANHNGRRNCEYLAADAGAVFAAIPFAGADTAVIVDPPRKGCGDAFLAQLAAFAPRTVVYVSCNPETQARDVEALASSGYKCVSVQPFDMFPQTKHVEAVATLVLSPG